MRDHSQYKKYNLLVTHAQALSIYMFHLLVTHEQAISIDICFIY